MPTELKTNQQYRLEAVEVGLAIEVKPNFLLFSSISPERFTFETFEEYKFRQKITKRTTKKYLNPKN
jgi:hypothetical protein